MTDQEAWVHFASAVLGTTIGLPMNGSDVAKLKDAQGQSREALHAAIKEQQAERAKGVVEWADAMLVEYKKRFSV